MSIALGVEHVTCICDADTVEVVACGAEVFVAVIEVAVVSADKNAVLGYCQRLETMGLSLNI